MFARGIIALAIVTLAFIIGLGLVSAQQQNDVSLSQAPAPKPVCNYTTTKPSPEAKKLNFNTSIVAEFAAYIVVEPGKYFSLDDPKVNTTLSKGNNSDLTLVVNYTCAQLSFKFDHSNDSQVYVKAINGLIRLDNANGTAETYFQNDTALFTTTQSGHYYRCNSEQPVVLNVIPGLNKFSLVMSKFAYEVFRNVNSTDYYKIPEQCPLDSGPVSDLVRIGVGVSLVALVAIVLVAYFVGRRRWSERSSYESV